MEKANSIQAVEKVQYSKDVVDSITSIASTTRIFGLSIVGILIAMAMVIINNTIRLSVYSRRREINDMKYIVPDWYIRWPFLMEGMLLGLFGAVLSSGLVAAVYSLLEKRMGGPSIENNLLSLFQLLPLDAILYQIAVLFILIGSIVRVNCQLTVHAEAFAGLGIIVLNYLQQCIADFDKGSE